MRTFECLLGKEKRVLGGDLNMNMRVQINMSLMFQTCVVCAKCMLHTLTPPRAGGGARLTERVRLSQLILDFLRAKRQKLSSGQFLYLMGFVSHP